MRRYVPTPMTEFSHELVDAIASHATVHDVPRLRGSHVEVARANGVPVLVRVGGIPAGSEHAAYATVDGEVRVEPSVDVRYVIAQLPAALAAARRRVA